MSLTSRYTRALELEAHFLEQASRHTRTVSISKATYWTRGGEAAHRLADRAILLARRLKARAVTAGNSV